MKTLIAVVGFAVLLFGISSKHVGARAPYFEQFEEKYSDLGGIGYPKRVEKAKCAVCHKGNSKKERNSYGMALSKVITKNEKQKAKIDKALGEIENEKSPSGETFIELIKQGKLPGENG